MPVSESNKYPPFIPYDARLFLCVGGSGVISADGVDYKMDRGALIIINSGVPYHLKSGEKEVLYFAVNFDFVFDNSNLTTPVPPSYFDEYAPSRLIGHVEFSDLEEFNKVVYLRGMTHLESKCTAAEREYSRQFKFRDGVVSAMLSEILFECARGINVADNPTENKLEQILDYIHVNFNKPINNKELGNVFSFHPNYINEMVRRSTGTSLHQYLLKIRLAKAIDLLEETSDPITDIANACGFQSLYYFSRYFKKAVGVAPSKYRRK